MKLLSHIRVARGNAVAEPRNWLRIAISSEPDTASHDRWFKYRYDVTVGCIVSGPDYAVDALQVQATQIIGHHIYGEVEEMLRDLFRAACEEGASMELRDQISRIISECRALK